MDDNQAEAAAAATSQLIELIGVAATLGPAATPDQISAAVLVSEFPQSLVQRRYGLDDARMADVTCRIADLADATPAKGWKVTVTEGPQAVEWTVLGIERRDAVAVVLRVRTAVRATATAPGAREVRR